jgi:deoxyribonucleoside regulator
MSELLTPERHRLLSEVAELYYNKGLSQQEIAKRVKLARSTISRLLLEARDLNIVEININHLLPTAMGLEARLAQRFALRSAHVLERGSATDDDVFRKLGRLGAMVLAAVLKDGMILGLSWGTTVHVVVEELRPTRLPNVKVVQLLGGVGAPYHSIDGPEQVRRAKEMFGAQHYYLNAPMLVDNPEVAAALREDHSIREVLELARQAHVALVGIGSIVPEVSTQYHSGYISYDKLRTLDQQGVVGAICTSFFNLQGEHVPAPWCDDCAIGISWGELSRVPTVIGIATGKRKGPAILGALRSGAVHILVTDDATAEEVLRLDGQSQ